MSFDSVIIKIIALSWYLQQPYKQLSEQTDESGTPN